MIPEDTIKKHRVALIATSSDCTAIAQQLAQELAIPLIAKADPNYDYFLVCTPTYLGLQTKALQKPFYIDFLSGKSHYRRTQATTRNELLVRALGCRPRDEAKIVDATAGLGRDSLLLASLGFSVTMLERSSILYVLLRDALLRAKKDANIAASIDRLKLVHADAKDWLQQTHEQPDVIYLDPMFPERKKSALVKQEMVILQTLLGKDEDAHELLAIAQQVARKRVVVKRPRLAATIDKQAPSYTVLGKSSRFDIYLLVEK